MTFYWIIVGTNFAFAALPPYGRMNVVNLVAGSILALVLLVLKAWA